MSKPLGPVVYVDVDDTLVRSFGSKRMAMPAVVQCVRELNAAGFRLYCWSTAGADYCRVTAQELGILDCFQGFLPKPEIIIDDTPQRLACTPMDASERSCFTAARGVPT